MKQKPQPGFELRSSIPFPLMITVMLSMPLVYICIHISISMYVYMHVGASISGWVCVDRHSVYVCIYPTLPHRQDVTQGQF